jgi:hypothetical protein
MADFLEALLAEIVRTAIAGDKELPRAERERALGDPARDALP